MSGFNFDFEIVKAGAPIVTLSSLGIAFNQLSRSLLGNPEAINIGFDKENMTIGVKRSDINDKVKYEFEKKEKNRWVRIGCKDFIRYLSELSGMEFKKAKQFIASYDENINMLLIKIDEEHLKNK